MPDRQTKSHRLARFFRERLLALGAGVSIAVLIGVIVTRSNGTGYFGSIGRDSSGVAPTRSLGFGIDTGDIVVAWTKEEPPTAGGLHYGFGLRKDRASDFVLRVPFWAAVPLLCIFPVRFAWVYYRQLRRSRPGRCAKCGYDLRATPERCPECGEAPV